MEPLPARFLLLPLAFHISRVSAVKQAVKIIFALSVSLFWMRLLHMVRTRRAPLLHARLDGLALPHTLISLSVGASLRR